MLDPDTTEHPLPCSCHLTRCIVTRTFMLDHPTTANQTVLQNCEIDDEEDDDDEDNNVAANQNG